MGFINTCWSLRCDIQDALFDNLSPEHHPHGLVLTSFTVGLIAASQIGGLITTSPDDVPSLAQTSNNNKPPPPSTMSVPKSGIKVVVVGAGFGGLTAAIECHRQGHDVSIYENFAELKILGDIISFGANAGRIYHRWSDGMIARRLRELCIDLSEYGFRIHKYDTGEVVYHQKTPPQDPEAPVMNGHRGELHEVVFNYARDELGIPIHLGQPVEEYFEDENQAGIVLKSGERVVADLVIGADGVRSKARELVLGYVDKPKSSGYAVWRAWYASLPVPSAVHSTGLTCPGFPTPT
jgi:hypothetical protein